KSGMHLMSNRYPKILRHQSGTTLIEVLITVLVMSVGLLGLAALQGFSLQAGQIACYRALATNVAYEISDFARVNRSAAIASCTIPILPAWNAFVAEQLPGGQVVAIFDQCGVEEIKVTVSWAEDRIADVESSGREQVQVVTRI